MVYLKRKTPILVFFFFLFLPLFGLKGILFFDDDLVIGLFFLSSEKFGGLFELFDSIYNTNIK